VHVAGFAEFGVAVLKKLHTRKIIADMCAEQHKMLQKTQSAKILFTDE